MAQELLDLVDPTGGNAQVTQDGLEYGYAGMRMILEERTLRVWWVGEVPDTVTKVLDQIPDGDRVEVVPAKFTLFDEERAALRLMASERVKPLAEETQLDLVTPLENGSGLEVTYRTVGTEVDDEVAAAAGVVAGIPVAAHVEASGNKLLTARWADGSPWHGGAGYKYADAGGTHYCSTGFGVAKESSGNQYLLTAYHCFYGYVSGTQYVETGSGDQVGHWDSTNSAVRDPTHDAALIRPTSHSVKNSVFTGSATSSSKAPIVGAGNNVDGQIVCTSGAMSGEHCALITASVNSYIAYGPDGTRLSGVDVGGSPTGATAAETGDSGGPVLYESGGKMYGVGMIDEGTDPTTCPSGGSYINIGGCYGTVFWVSLKGILSKLNLDLVTD